METEIITKTGREVFDALNEFGVHHVREKWLQQNGAKIDACILGGTAYNLGVVPNYDYTDDTEHTLEHQLDKVTVSKELLSEYGLGDYDGDFGVAQFLIALNDKRLDYDELRIRYSEDVFKSWGPRDDRFFKYSFEEIKEAARKALTPYRDTVFTFRAINIDPINVDASWGGTGIIMEDYIDSHDPYYVEQDVVPMGEDY